MAIRITCPDCDTALTLADDKRGKKVRCKACEKVLSVPGINGKAHKHADDDDEQNEVAVKTKAKRAATDEEDSGEDESDRPKKKKKKKKPGGFPIVLVASLAVVFLLLLGGGGWLVYIFTRPVANQQAKAQEQPGPPPQPGKLGGNVVKNPKTLLGNIRARGDQVERDAAMRGTVALYHAYCDEVKNPASRNLDGFLQSIRAEPGKIVSAVKNKEFLINFKASPSSGDIVVYESEQYDQGYFCFFANNQSAYLSPEQMKAAGIALPAPAP